jgi:hypothetical protein
LRKNNSTTDCRKIRWGNKYWAGPINKRRPNNPTPARRGLGWSLEQSVGLRKARPNARIFLEKDKKIKLEKEMPVGKILKNSYLPPADWAGGVGPRTSRPSSGREVPRGPLREFFICEEVPAGVGGGIPPIQRAGCCPEGHPALWSGGMPSPRLYKPEPAPKILFYSAKIRKKEREERKREEEAANPCSHVNLEVYSYSSRIIT